MRRMVRNVLVLLLAMAFLAPAVYGANTLDKIKKDVKIVIGVKTDYRPWGFLDPSGKYVGMEIDMAYDIAKRLGVKPELVTVQSGNRNEFLLAGKIDLILATMSESPARRQVLGIIDPGYYAGGTNILAKKSMGFKKWNDLRGKKVSGIQGAYYNRRVGELYGPEILSFPGIAEALTDLENGNCVAFLQDSTLIESMLNSRDPKWAGYEMPLPTEDERTWHMAVLKDEVDGPYGQFFKNLVIEWHKAGYLIELNKKWKLSPVPFLEEMHKKYK